MQKNRVKDSFYIMKAILAPGQHMQAQVYFCIGKSDHMAKVGNIEKQGDGMNDMC
jgi:hypothetical protein